MEWTGEIQDQNHDVNEKNDEYNLENVDDFIYLGVESMKSGNEVDEIKRWI